MMNKTRWVLNIKDKGEGENVSSKNKEDSNRNY